MEGMEIEKLKVGTMLQDGKTHQRMGKYIIWKWECAECGYDTHATTHQMKSYKIYRCPSCEPLEKKIQKKIEKIGTMILKKTLGNEVDGDPNRYLWVCECGQYEVEATTSQIRQKKYLCPYCSNFKEYGTMKTIKVVGEKYKDKQLIYLWECKCGQYQVEATMKEIKRKVNACPHCTPKEQIKIGTMIQLKKTGMKNGEKEAIYGWECECGRFQINATSKGIHRKKNQCPKCLKERLIQKEETVNHFKIIAKTDKHSGSYVVYEWKCEFCEHRIVATKKQIEFEKYSRHDCKRIQVA